MEHENEQGTSPQGKDQGLSNEVQERSPDPTPEYERLFHEGLASLKSGGVDAAVDALESSCKSFTKQKGEMHPECYKYYYHYAEALLRQYEDNKGAQIFGDAVLEASEEPVSEEESSEEEPQLKQDDLETIWDTLEVVRVLLTSSVTDLEYLYKVHSRLGELLTWKEDFLEANSEYAKAQEVLLQTEGTLPSRQKAELYYLQGVNSLNTPGNEENAVNQFSDALYQLEAVKLSAGPEETAEILAVIAEVQTKREDSIEQQESLRVLKEQPTENLESFDSPSMENVQDLGTLGKRRREEVPEDDPENPANLPNGSGNQRPQGN